MAQAVFDGAVAKQSAYTGPVPSPARVWAPWVIAASALCAAGTFAQFVLNMLERHYQQRRLTSTPPSAARIHSVLQTLHVVSLLTIGAAAFFLVVGVVWSKKRRPRSLRLQYGESAVEPTLVKVQPAVYVGFWLALAVSVVAALRASSYKHPAMTIDDFVSYRTWLAVCAAARTAMWASWIPLVARATQLQDQRESAAVHHRIVPMTPAFAKTEERRARLGSKEVSPKVVFGVIAAVLGYFAVFLVILVAHH